MAHRRCSRWWRATSARRSRAFAPRRRRRFQIGFSSEDGTVLPQRHIHGLATDKGRVSHSGALAGGAVSAACNSIAAAHHRATDASVLRHSWLMLRIAVQRKSNRRPIHLKSDPSAHQVEFCAAAAATSGAATPGSAAAAWTGSAQTRAGESLPSSPLCMQRIGQLAEVRMRRAQNRHDRVRGGRRQGGDDDPQHRPRCPPGESVKEQRADEVRRHSRDRDGKKIQFLKSQFADAADCRAERLAGWRR